MKFLAGLVVFRDEGLLHDFEKSKRSFMAGMGGHRSCWSRTSSTYWRSSATFAAGRLSCSTCASTPACSTCRSTAWPPPVPLRAAPAVPLFPVELLSPWMAEWASAQAIELQVPVDLPAMLALGAAAGGLARKVSVTSWAGWGGEPVNLFVMCALPPGERKSAAFRKALAPVVRAEKAAQEAAEPGTLAAESDHRVASKRVAHLEDKIAKATKDDAGALRDELRAARQELEKIIVPVRPLFRVDDDTPEMLALELCRQHGRLLAASPEAKTLENIVRDKKANFDVFLKGHAGDDMRAGRISRGRDQRDKPALTCLYSPQPAVLEELAETPGLAQRGFMARWFYSLPVSNVGYRDCSKPTDPVPDETAQRYAALMAGLWQLPTPETDLICDMQLTADAATVLTAFTVEVEALLRPGGLLNGLAGWGNKAAGLAVRVAGILACTDAVGRDEPLPYVIDADAVTRAVRLVKEYAIPHAIAAFDLMGTEPTVVLARVVLNHLRKQKPMPTSFSCRDVFRGLQGRFSTVDELLPVLELLERHELIRPTGEPPRPGPGRKPSPVYLINPKAFGEDGLT